MSLKRGNSTIINFSNTFLDVSSFKFFFMKKRLLQIAYFLISFSLLGINESYADHTKYSHSSEENYLFKSEKLTVSHLYPNPAFDYVDVDVQINANFSEVKLLIFNILGQQIKEVNLETNLKTQRINLRDLNPGMYPYQLVVDGKSLVTKKLIVK